MTISKSEFMMFLRHPAWLWLKKFKKEVIPEVDADLQARFDEGTLFESYAERIFPGAVRLGYKKEGGEFSGTMYYALPDETKKHIDEGTKTILQGRIEVSLPKPLGNITAICDVLDRVKDKTFDLYEIKSSTAVKPEHTFDLAFQTIVLERAGLDIRKISVIHVDKHYVRDGDIKPDKISATTEITGDVREAIDETKDSIRQAFKVLAQKEMPSLSPRYLNNNLGEWLPVVEAVQGPLPKYSIAKLCHSKPQILGLLEDLDVETLDQIPDDFELSEKQFNQVRAVKTGVQEVDKESIKDFLDTLEFPLYFFDFETFSGVIPAFDGVRPYQQVPFQYSLHILDKPGGELRHFEYLHEDRSLPAEELLKHMQDHFQGLDAQAGKGSVVSWFMSFEKGRNKEMAEMFPKYEKFLLNINDRMVDLMTPFSKNWFIDKDFFGSASIKWVLPVLVPELSYKELDISEGGQAQRVWMETILSGKNPKEKSKTMKNLKKYCALDTYAMYAIYKYLLDKVS